MRPIILTVLIACIPLAAADNLIRNGSFEHSRQYWMENGEVVTDAAAPHGTTCLKLEGKGNLRSMPITLEPGRRVTVSFWAKAAEAGQVGINPSPSNRMIGQKHHWIWNKDHTFRAAVGTQWQRVSIDFQTPSLDGSGGFIGSDHSWWNNRSWIFTLGGPKPLWIDGLSVAYEGAGAEAYLPWAPLEVTATALDLPGYSPAANLLDPAKPITIRGAAFNPSAAATEAVLRFEQFDYTGTRSLADPIDHPVTIPAGDSVTVEQAITLAGRGLVLARVSVLRDGAVVDRSDQPLTALAFPKAATEHDPRERFGGSFRSRHLVEAGQAIGLAWTRWYPQLSWKHVQSENGESWDWPTDTLEHLWAHGIGATAVLHAVPKWAAADTPAVDKHLAADMQWPADDRRWQDLSIETGWDRYLTTIATRYRGTPMVYEFANEPDISDWDSAVYARMAKRTYDRIKAVDPEATVLANVTWPKVSGWTRGFVQRGGLDAMDGHSFHNYVPGELSQPDGVSSIQRLFSSFGSEDEEIWFNEGWIYVRSSLDYPAAPIVFDHAAEPADIIVRSAAQLLAVGLDKFITFHIGYGQHGKSFWDWVGSGTEWWDDHGHPTVAVGAFNGLCHFLGLSESAGTIEADGAVLHVFHDLRGERGVAVCWATGNGAALALPGDGLTAYDLMGNPIDAVRDGALHLATKGRPVYLVGAADGEALHASLAPLQVVADDSGFAPPAGWFGTAVGTSNGNPLLVDGAARWQVDQIWPDDPLDAANYRPLVWNGTTWVATANGHGGQPALETANDHYRLVGRAPWGGNQGEKIAALSFIAPADGRYGLSADPRLQNWDGKGKAIRLRILVHRGDSIEEIHRIDLEDRERAELRVPAVKLAAGDRLVLVPAYPDMHVAGGIELRDLRVTEEGTR